MPLPKAFNFGFNEILRSFDSEQFLTSLVTKIYYLHSFR